MEIQGTAEWFASRLGKVTASRVSDVLAKKTTAAYRNYMAQLVAERLTNEQPESYTNAAMQRGTELEPDARSCYEFVSGNTVEEVGLVDHPSVDMSGASPDGLINGGLGLVEIKCPNTANHIDYLLSNKVPTQYVNQIQWQIACTGANWCDFVSYDPRLPQSLQLFIVRVDRDAEKIDKLEEAVVSFLVEVSSMVKKLEERITP